MADIQKVSEQILAVKDYSKEDQYKPERAEALVRLYDDLNKQKKEIDKNLSAIKSTINSLIDETGETTASIYGFDNQQKIQREVARGEQREITEDNLLNALYAYYGEDINDKKGKAWEAFKSVTKVNPVPRIIDESKIEKAIVGLNDLVPTDLVCSEDVMTVKPASYKLVLRKMTKNEEGRYANRELNSFEPMGD